MTANATGLPNIEKSLPAQSHNNDNCHVKRKGHEAYDMPEMKTVLIYDRRVQPFRKKIPSSRYPATGVTFELDITREQPLILSMSCVTCKHKITCDTR